jgi:hypothetical protein
MLTYLVLAEIDVGSVATGAAKLLVIAALPAHRRSTVLMYFMWKSG